MADPHWPAPGPAHGLEPGLSTPSGRRQVVKRRGSVDPGLHLARCATSQVRHEPAGVAIVPTGGPDQQPQYEESQLSATTKPHTSMMPEIPAPRAHSPANRSNPEWPRPGARVSRRRPTPSLHSGDRSTRRRSSMAAAVNTAARSAERVKHTRPLCRRSHVALSRIRPHPAGPSAEPDDARPTSTRACRAAPRPRPLSGSPQDAPPSSGSPRCRVQ